MTVKAISNTFNRVHAALAGAECLKLFYTSRLLFRIFNQPPTKITMNLDDNLISDILVGLESLRDRADQLRDQLLDVLESADTIEETEEANDDDNVKQKALSLIVQLAIR